MKSVTTRALQSMIAGGSGAARGGVHDVKEGRSEAVMLLLLEQEGMTVIAVRTSIKM